MSDRIRRKLKGQKTITDEDEWLIDIHHKFMVVYGWIPIEEFKNIPIPTFINLIPHVETEYAKHNQKRLALLRLAGVKNPK